MSTALIQFSGKEIELLRKTIAPGTSDDQLALFVQVCSQLGLNPFARQIYAVVRNERQSDGKYERKMTIQTSIDGYRLLAQRSGEYAGQEGPFWYDAEINEWVDIWLKDYHPAAAKVGVMRKGFSKPIYSVARFDTYAARYFDKESKEWKLTPMWVKMPEVMIAKVAEALCLRRAFPAELSGIYTKEEMDQADEPLPTVDVTTKVVDASESHQNDSSESQPEQANISTLAQKQPSHDRLTALYNKALDLKLFESGVDELETKRKFLAFAGSVLHVNITAAGHLTASRLDGLEAYINSKDAA